MYDNIGLDTNDNDYMEYYSIGEEWNGDKMDSSCRDD